MWLSGFCSRPWSWRSLLLIAIAIGSVSVAASDTAATLEAAARRILPLGSTIVRRTEILDDAQLEAVQKLSNTPASSRLVLHWIARGPEGGTPLAHAYADTHVVRTKPETLLILIDATGMVQRVEVVTFSEPPEYQVSERWLAQFTGQTLDPELALKRSIRVLSGATLSSQAATDAVRRVLAIHRVIHTAAP
ncbi:MAG: FMN-binding protein [Acidobacteriota bacterium]